MRKTTSERIEKQMRFSLTVFLIKEIIFYYAWKYRCVIFPESDQKLTLRRRS